MTIRYLLDTNIVILALRKRPEIVRRRFSGATGSLAVSVVTVAELAYGAEKSAHPDRNSRATAEFLGMLDIVPLDATAAEHAGRIRAELASVGSPIGAYDTLIAGHARSRGLIVVTNTTREFSRVKGLLVEDWSVA